METNIISVKYEDIYTPKAFSGMDYNYYINTDKIKNIKVGDLVIAPTKYGDKIARVSEINIPEYKVETIKPCLRTIEKKINKQKYLQANETIGEVA